MTSIKLSTVFIAKFKQIWKLAKSGKYLRIVLKGGRGSGKSTAIAMIIILLMMMFPISALVVRKVASTLRESVYEELKEAISILKVERYWHITSGILSMTYLPRGNKIIFRGADDPQKIKSLKVSKFPVALLWLEELAEFKNEEEVSTIENSVLRAELPKGLFYLLMYSYNPPKRKQSWVNKKYETQFVSENTFVHHSTYLDNPYISKAFVSEAEDVKERNEGKYNHIYLGDPIGSGVVPFNNLEFRTIADDEYKTFDNIRQGIDWGYATDPVALVRWHYDKTRRTIYAMDEIYGVKMSNRNLANAAEKRGFFNYLTSSDVSPRNINEVKTEHGWTSRNLKSAKKGPDSVRHGEEWLDDLDAIVIDPKRTPNIAREFENIDYQVDRDGNHVPRLEDKDNHTIDATRYAFENDMKNKKGIRVLE